MNTKETVVERIIELCKERSIAINALANISVVSPSTIYRMLNDKRQNQGIVSIKKLCDGGEISLREFFDSPLFDELEQETQVRLLQNDRLIKEGCLSSVLWLNSARLISFKLLKSPYTIRQPCIFLPSHLHVFFISMFYFCPQEHCSFPVAEVFITAIVFNQAEHTLSICAQQLVSISWILKEIERTATLLFSTGFCNAIPQCQ